MRTTISLTFSGYWADPNTEAMPARSGIYCVYDGVPDGDRTVNLRQLLYIGESGDIRTRISNHEKRPAWRRHLQPGGVLYFSCAIGNRDERLRGEAAMIFEHKPPVNEEYRHEFPFDETTMLLSGEIALLRPYFTVHRTSARPRW